MNVGDGVTVNYYDNEVFLNEPKTVMHDSLTFLWNGESPVEGINATDFSAM